MSNPYKDRKAEEDRKKRKKISEDYMPVILWVKFPEIERYDFATLLNEVKERLIETVDNLMFFEVAKMNEPYAEVRTEFQDKFNETDIELIHYAVQNSQAELKEQAVPERIKSLTEKVERRREEFE